MKVLQINCGINGKESNSTKLANYITKNLNPSCVNIRDLNENKIPHLNSEVVGAFYTPEKEVTEDQKKSLTLSDTLISEINNSDIVVIGVPMYNFGIPSTLKAWIDQIARVGKTFRYTENGPEGLIKNKKVIIAAARGGFYKDSESDVQSEYLKLVLGFLGIKDIEFVYAEGLAMNELDFNNLS